jgi:hypothetical protein
MKLLVSMRQACKTLIYVIITGLETTYKFRLIHHRCNNELGAADTLVEGSTLQLRWAFDRGAILFGRHCRHALCETEKSTLGDGCKKGPRSLPEPIQTSKLLQIVQRDMGAKAVLVVKDGGYLTCPA